MKVGTTKLDDEGRELLNRLGEIESILTHGRLAAAQHITSEVLAGRPFLGWQDDARVLLANPR